MYCLKKHFIYSHWLYVLYNQSCWLFYLRVVLLIKFEKKLRVGIRTRPEVLGQRPPTRPEHPCTYHSFITHAPVNNHRQLHPNNQHDQTEINNGIDCGTHGKSLQIIIG